MKETHETLLEKSVAPRYQVAREPFFLPAEQNTGQSEPVSELGPGSLFHQPFAPFLWYVIYRVTRGNQFVYNTLQRKSLEYTSVIGKNRM